MSKELAVMTPSAVDAKSFFSDEQMDLIRRQIAPKATADELKLFLYQAARTGLDPLSRQIYAIHRKDGDSQKMTIQTSIDGFRLIAERTGRYAPGQEAKFEYVTKDGEDKLKKATAFVMKQTLDGKWHEVAASAHFWEYAQTNYKGELTKMWAEKPHVMLSKCAEALALRKAFPAEMSGIYTAEEMSKADEPEYIPPERKAPKASSTTHSTPSQPSAPSSIADLPYDKGESSQEAAPSASASAPGAAGITPTHELKVIKLATDTFPGATVQTKVTKDPERVGRIRKLALFPKPDGLGWHKKHAFNWLKLLFATESPDKLTDLQQYDAEGLLSALMESEDAYNQMIDYLIDLKRIRPEAVSSKKKGTAA